MSPTVSVTDILLWEAAAASKSRTVHKMFKPETEALTQRDQGETQGIKAQNETDARCRDTSRLRPHP